MTTDSETRPVNFYLTNALEAYLSSNNPGYAFLIKAPWGTGKTYFIQNELPATEISDLIESKKNDFLGERKLIARQVLHFSLNGCADLIEFRKRLLRALVPSLKNNKRGEIASQFLDAMKEKVGIDPTIFAAQSSVCYVIDDLERCKMSIEETLGAINELVENLDCHVVILANEDEIDEHAKWSQIREKVIGETYEYRCDVDTPYSTFIKGLKHPLAKQFLKTGHAKSKLLRTFDIVGNGNLRILSRSLKVIDTAFSHIPGTWLVDYEEKLAEFIVYILYIYCSIHQGIISRGDLESIRLREYGDIFRISHDSPEFKSFLKVLNDSGINTNHRFLSGQTVYEIFSDGYVDGAKIQIELSALPHFKPIEGLESWQLVWYGQEIDDDVFQSAKADMEKKWKSREYSAPGKILHVNMLRLWLAEMGELELDEEEAFQQLDSYLIDVVKQGAFQQEVPEDNFHREIYKRYGLSVTGETSGNYFGKPAPNLYNKTIVRIENARKDVLESQHDNWACRLIGLAIEDPQAFQQEAAYGARGAGGPFIHTPVFSKTHAHKLIIDWVGLSNKQKQKVVLSLRERYRHGSLTKELKNEVEFITKFIDLVSNFSNTLKGMQKYRLNLMMGWLTECLPKKDEAVKD